MANPLHTKVSSAISLRAALGLPFGLLTLAALSQQPAHALATPSFGLDSTAAGNNSLTTSGANEGITSSRRLMRTFKMGNYDAVLQGIRLGVAIPSAGQTRDLEITVFEANTSGAIDVPVGSVLGSQIFTLPAQASANVPFYQVINPTGTLASMVFKNGKDYGIIFRSNTAQTINLRRCNALSGGVPNCAAFPIVEYGGVDSLDGSIGNVISGSLTWADATDLQQNTYMQLNFNPVPAPALMGASYISGMLAFSRRLRTRIKAKTL